MEFKIDIPGEAIEATQKKIAVEKILKNFSTANVLYLAELSEKKDSNKKFDSLKNNPIVKSLL